MGIKHLLTDYLCQSYNLNLNENYEVEYINAKELITKDRIDLIAKLKYIEFKEKGYNLSFIKELYTAHIEAFSLGTFTEPGNEKKNSIEEYFKTFDHLIENIKNNGFDETVSIIPVGSNNVILDGSHRVAIAAYLNLDVPIIRFENISVIYDAQFFRDRLLDSIYIDYLVSEYCKIKQNVYFAYVWPKAKGKHKQEKMNLLINNSCGVVYKKKIKLNYQGFSNLVIQTYSTEEWIGDIDNNFLGAKNKVDAVYDKNGMLTIYVLDCENLNKVTELKNNIRELFKLGTHSIHITDSQIETIQSANLLLNQNSVEFLNVGKPYYNKELYRSLDEFKNRIINHHFSTNDFIIDSSCVLELYGSKEIHNKDIVIKFMTISTGYEVIEDDYVQNHHEYINYYKTSIDNLVLNPNCYFFYNDLKFLALDELLFFKKNRLNRENQAQTKSIDRTCSFKDRKNSIKRKIKYSKFGRSLLKLNLFKGIKNIKFRGIRKE